MYFHDRAEAGRKLAEKLDKYKSQHIVVVALGEGSSIVAAQVAMKLHANMFLYLIKDIDLPGENTAFAGLGSGDVFAYNTYFSPGQLEEFAGEYRSYIEQQRMDRSHELHALLGNEGEIEKSMLRHRTVILIADGLGSGYSLDVAQQFVKTIAIKSLIIATPVASINAVDRMHLVGDEIYCLSVIDNFMGVDHYYDDNTIPTVPAVMKMMKNIALNWDREEPKTAAKPKPGKSKPQDKPAEKVIAAPKSEAATPKPNRKKDDDLKPIPLDHSKSRKSSDDEDEDAADMPDNEKPPVSEDGEIELDFDDPIEIKLH